MEPDPRLSEKNKMTSPPIDTRSTFEKEHPALAGHDSMVTVRLSEPPSLSVRTDLPPNVLPSRRSIFGPEYTPTPTSATSPKKQEQEVGVVQEQAVGDTSITTVDESKNLSQELQDADQDATAEDEPDESRTSMDESMDDSEDEVNWDKLQKSEDEQAQSDDNVSSLLHGTQS